MAILVLFFCSGATALVYEIVWSKYLSLMFGSTIYAQSTVLAVFMGGLALGNRIFGQYAERLSHPLAAYGRLEVAIGIYAFLFSGLYQASDRLFVKMGAPLLDHPSALLALKGAFSVALLLGPTILMGGTLPIIGAWLVRRGSDASRWSARFYAINTLGAFVGSWIAGFYLVRAWGLVLSLQITGLANLMIGLLAIVLARKARTAFEQSTASDETPQEEHASGSAHGLGLALVMLTGAMSMGLEVLAARSLSLIFGASLQAFAIMLMAFILGIGLGSSAISSPRLPRVPRGLLIACLLLAAATWVGVLIAGIEEWVVIYRRLKVGLALNPVGYFYHHLTAGAFAIVLLGVPAALMGAVLPLCIREARSAQHLSSQIGRLLTSNTLGAVAGVLLTGFFLMPTAGLRSSFGLIALTLSTAALFLAIRERHRSVICIAGCVCAGLVVVLMTGGENWRNVMSSGAFRIREGEFVREGLKLRKELVTIAFYEDAPDATVSVELSEREGSVHPDTGLRVNGKVDASNRGDLATQYLLAHLPMMLRPQAKDVFVLGLGSGITAGAVLGHPVEQVVIAENCEPVIRASNFFTNWNRQVLSDRRVKVRIEDGRTILKLSPQLYDVIISEPSNPWMAGVGSVFSLEFYQVAAARLKPSGLLVQWFHVYEMSDPIVAMILRTFSRVFPHFEVWDVSQGDIMLIGSPQPFQSDLPTYARIFERELPRQDLASVGLTRPEQILSRQLASQRTAHVIPGPGMIQSDGFPVLEYDAPQAFYIGGRAQELTFFDERTWQMDLADAGKNQALRTLSVQDLEPVFNQHGSANASLDQHLRMRFKPSLQVKDEDVYFGYRRMPSVFRKGLPDTNAIPADANPPLAALLKRDNALRSNPDLAKASAFPSPPAGSAPESDRTTSELDGLSIPDLLHAYQKARKRGEWPTSYLAHDLAKPFIAAGNFEDATPIIQAGLQHDPNEVRLLFLLRWIESQRPTPPLAGRP